MILDLPAENQKRLIERLMPHLKVDLYNKPEEKIVGEVFRNYKEQNKSKSDESYKVASAMSPILIDKSQRNICKNLGVSNSKASEFKENNFQRKNRKCKYSDKEFNDIWEFYHRGDVSRVENGETTKKYGQTSFMRVTLKKAYKMFTGEYNIQISFKYFSKLKPKNIKVLAKTPLKGCQCAYCQNVNLKLKVLGIPEIKSEQDVYIKLICGKNTRFRNYDCISKKCNKCKNRTEKLELQACTLDMEKQIVWQKWENIDFEQKTGKKVTKKVLIKKHGTVRKCLNEFIQIDVLKPSQGFTFIQHFFTQLYQFQVYLDCKDSLEPGQCLIIQDFAQNLELYFRYEIKSSHYAKTQISVHPSVCFYKTSDSEETQRFVITHLSDITQHDAHLVHHMTKECISILKEKHKEVKWKKFYLWSDGCSRQYKGKHSFFFLDKFDVPVERNFFGSEHGKN